MLLPDVNVLVYAFRKESPRHAEYRAWLEALIRGDEAYGMADLVLSGFIRVVTHPRVFQHPDPVEDALAFAAVLRSQPQCVPVLPGARHWSIFTELCARAAVKGNLVPDAFLAALAIESGCVWVTTDGDYARFPKLRWRHPLSP